MVYGVHNKLFNTYSFIITRVIKYNRFRDPEENVLGHVCRENESQIEIKLYTYNLNAIGLGMI